MFGFNSKVSNLLQTLKEGEREKVLAQLDPQVAEKLKERRNKERRAPGEGGINPERSKSESKARHSGVPDYDPSSALVESAGKFYKQNNPDDGEFSEDESDSSDYTTCQRPDGSKYGTGGQCRKGKETTPTEKKSAPTVNGKRITKEQQMLLQSVKEKRMAVKQWKGKYNDAMNKALELEEQGKPVPKSLQQQIKLAQGALKSYGVKTLGLG